MKKSRRGKRLLILGLILLLAFIFVVGVFVWYVFVGPDYSYKYRGNGKVLENPVSGLSMEEAIEQFDEDDVFYLLVVIEGFNLHSPPLSDDLPKVEFHADGDIFNVVVIDGEIRVNIGEIENEDMIIYSSKEEGVKMLMDFDYIVESFENGGSRIELVANEAELAMKGYLELYDNLTS